MNNSVFGKTMENVRKHRDIKLVTTEERIKLVSEPNYHTTKHFSNKLLVIEMKKTKAKMNTPVYLGMTISDISKMEDDSEMKKAKGVKRCVIKRRLMFENYKVSLFNNKTIMRPQLTFKSDHHNVYTEEVNKIAPNSNDNKRLQTFDGVTTYSYGTNAFKVCESEMLSKINCKV